MPIKPRPADDEDQTPQTPESPTGKLDSHLEFAKWLAIIAMVIDHVGYLFPDKVDYTTWRSIGRLCWPLIAWVVAMRLYVAPDRTARYLKRLLPWALVAQVPYTAIFLEFRNLPWWDAFNIFITIGFGCTIFLLLEMWDRVSTAKKAGIVAATIFIVVISRFVDYGPVGAVTIPVLAILARQNIMYAAIGAGIMGALANVLILVGDDILAKYWVLGVAPLLASLIAVLCLRVELPMPRLPGWFFYLFYPLHLLVLLMVFLAVHVNMQGVTP